MGRRVCRGLIGPAAVGIREGASDVEIAKLRGITVSLFHDAYEKNDAFAQFVTQAVHADGLVVRSR